MNVDLPFWGVFKLVVKVYLAVLLLTLILAGLWLLANEILRAVNEAGANPA